MSAPLNPAVYARTFATSSADAAENYYFPKTTERQDTDSSGNGSFSCCCIRVNHSTYRDHKDKGFAVVAIIILAAAFFALFNSASNAYYGAQDSKLGMKEAAQKHNSLKKNPNQFEHLETEAQLKAFAQAHALYHNMYSEQSRKCLALGVIAGGTLLVAIYAIAYIRDVEMFYEDCLLAGVGCLTLGSMGYILNNAAHKKAHRSAGRLIESLREFGESELPKPPSPLPYGNHTQQQTYDQPVYASFTQSQQYPQQQPQQQPAYAPQPPYYPYSTQQTDQAATPPQQQYFQPNPHHPANQAPSYQNPTPPFNPNAYMPQANQPQPDVFHTGPSDLERSWTPVSRDSNNH